MMGKSASLIYKTQSLSVCLSVCLSAIEIKLETFRYRQTYGSYITFFGEAKYAIFILIQEHFGGLRALIHTDRLAGRDRRLLQDGRRQVGYREVSFSILLRSDVTWRIHLSNVGRNSPRFSQGF